MILQTNEKLLLLETNLYLELIKNIIEVLESANDLTDEQKKYWILKCAEYNRKVKQLSDSIPPPKHNPIKNLSAQVF